jgi:hypothetical protein
MLRRLALYSTALALVALPVFAQNAQNVVIDTQGSGAISFLTIISLLPPKP